MAERREQTVGEIFAALRSKRDALQRRIDELERAIEGLELAKKHTKAPAKDRGSGMKAVRDVVSMQSGSFTVRDILNDCGSGEITSRLVSTALFRLADAGKIEVIERGVGQRPTTYKRRAFCESSVEDDVGDNGNPSERS